MPEKVGDTLACKTALGISTSSKCLFGLTWGLKTKYLVNNHIKQRKAANLEPEKILFLTWCFHNLNSTEFEAVTINSHQRHLNDDVTHCMTPSLLVSQCRSSGPSFTITESDIHMLASLFHASGPWSNGGWTCASRVRTELDSEQKTDQRER